MKWGCIGLSILVALLSGVLMFTVQTGHLPFSSPAAEIKVDEEAAAVNPPIRFQGGMLDELVTSLQKERESMEDARLRLNEREKNLQELHASYLTLRTVVESLQKDLETQLIKVDQSQAKNFKTLAGVYSRMDPVSASRALKNMDAERVALIFNQMDSRAMAAIMDSAVSSAGDGGEAVAQWSDAIRRLNSAAEGASL
jgi:flagellar motility protein MotE (MotC chaperone)